MTKSKLSAYAAYAFEALVAKMERRDEYPLNKFIEALGKESGPSTAPLFVTWNTLEDDGEASLRGCIGTFDALNLEYGIRRYSLYAGVKDTRFDPISVKELPDLECCVTILRDFEVVDDPFDWELGIHGVQASIEGRTRSHSATFLPDVAVEQGWDQLDTLKHLIVKAGLRTTDYESYIGKMKVTRYKGLKTSITYAQYLDVIRAIEEN